MLPVFDGVDKRTCQQAPRRHGMPAAQKKMDMVTTTYATVTKSANIKPD
jgi:hypothetical protein